MSDVPTPSDLVTGRAVLHVESWRVCDVCGLRVAPPGRGGLADVCRYSCSRCGYHHRHGLDGLACRALDGLVEVWPDVEPWCVCTLCGLMTVVTVMLGHYAYEHRREDITTGRLLDLVRDTPDVARYDGPSAEDDTLSTRSGQP